ncbi:MAG TPA: hypothetical protein PLF30_02350 [Candidatus Moranbacteria bacterium]|jgi:hypothetical protein|nr:hypothetical protein [Candidatus Moranbacteria bacterium]HOF42229.1 hypothetical protein [Candidatus Moranbacteria bacterium]HPX94372.1 hypothetical protein [Candidatus Moranbacteria bacterium]HQB59501.1 hypothetical protein [Candidatus Moranbacteria bacterium]
MKGNVRKALAISGIAITVGTAGIVYDASAGSGSDRSMHGSQQEKMTRSKKTENVKNRIKNLRSIRGTVTAKTGDSLIIKKGEKEYLLKINPDSRILNSKWQSLKLSDIKNGDRVRISVKQVDLVLMAKIVRNLSAK